jgi:hypothetical protein
LKDAATAEIPTELQGAPEFAADQRSSSFLEILKRDWWNIAVLIAFVVVVTIAIAKHEPFPDEGQAWLVARDVSPWTILIHTARFEGHPVLWFWLLAIPARLGLSYHFMNLISGIAATIAVYLLLWRSPFPTYIKVLLPFTYFFIYQYSVIGRAYALVAPLLFLTAIVYRKRLEHPYLFIFLLCLLINLEVMTALVALGIFIADWFYLRKEWPGLEKSTKRALVWTSVIFVAAFHRGPERGIRP